MNPSDIEKLTDSFNIFCNGEYVVLPGSRLYIYKTNGSMVACRKDLRYAGRITFLSGGRMLLCSSKAVFHMIDLRDGSDIWTAPYTKNELNAANIAISPDEAFAYTYDTWKGSNFISRLDLKTHEVQTHDMNMDAGASRGIICDESGIPCILKTLRETIGGQPFQQIGVRMHDFDGVSPGNTTTWKAKWSFPGSRNAVCFLDCTDRIVTNDLHIYDTSTGTSVNLLENETTWVPPSHMPSECWLDSSQRCLCVKYQTANVVIDISSRKVAAQYAADYRQGCLIGSEYWLCVNDRICRKPFPASEAALAPKTFLVSDRYCSGHPKLW